MPLPNGMRLGPYEIVSPIGAGGMGEVFRARDTRLERSVAIKVLPSEFAQDAQFRLRFEREARVIASLTHPHICTLHDIGSDNGVEFLVMELLEGETLASRLKKGPLTMPQVLQYGVQIAQALDVAHRAGVIHRDLKPGNIMLTKTGAKLLDFGLARASSASRNASPDASTHRQDFVTTGGVVLGTPQYMSPEQLGGEELDARTDIFSLGAVLYEMATGRKAFEASSRASLIAAIVGAEPPPISELQPFTPSLFEHVVQKCLAKDRDERWQSAHDIAEELRWIRESGSQAVVAVPVSAKKIKRQRATWLAASAGVAIVFSTVAWFASARWQRLHEPVSVYRFTVSTPPGEILVNESGAMALSPDGNLLTYAASGRDGSRLMVRKLSETTWRALDGTTGASGPFWSPDGTQIGFTAKGSLWKVAADGSRAPEEIARLPFARGDTGTWNRDGVIVFAAAGKLYRVRATGGDLGQLSIFPPTTIVLFPEFLPDGRHFLCSTRESRLSKTTRHYVASLDTKETPRQIISGANNASYADGYLFFVRSSMLYAQRFDPANLTLSGEPRTIAKVQAAYNAQAYFTVAGDKLLYVPVGSDGTTSLQRVDRSGNLIATIGQPSFFFSPRVSHDGTRVAVDQSPLNGPGDIWVLGVQTAAATRVTFSPENESAPAWGPEDRDLLYYMNREGKSVLMRKHIAAGEPSVFFSEVNSFTGDWSQDGKWVLALTTSQLLPQVTAISVADAKARPLGITAFAPRLSPDGRWLAYSAMDDSSISDVFVQPFPPNGSKWQISSEGGSMPVWNHDGKSLYFVTPGGKIMESIVDTTSDGSFSAHPPQALFSVSLLRDTIGMSSQYDVFPDGTFLVNRIPDSATTPMTVVLHWKQALEQ